MGADNKNASQKRGVRWLIVEVFECLFDGWAIETDDAFAVNFGDRNRGNSLNVGSINFFVFYT